jgi:nitrogen regulatory protein PII
LTICIAAIGDLQVLPPNPNTAPKIIFCADRMISAGLQFEHGVPKIQALTPFCYVMMSSDDSLTSDMIIKNVQAEIAGRNLTVEEIVEVFEDEAKAFKQDKREADILVPLGLTYESITNASTTLPRDLANTVANLLLNYEYKFRCDFLVFGLDVQPNASPKVSPHLWVVNQDGDSKLYDYLGFAAIGNGANTAFPELTKLLWHQGITMVEAIVRVFNAKKAAERMGGVGQFTDLYVLHVPAPDRQPVMAGLYRAPEDMMKLLDDGLAKLKGVEQVAYTEMVNGVVAEIQKSLAKEQGHVAGSGTTSAGTTVSSGEGTTQT